MKGQQPNIVREQDNIKKVTKGQETLVDNFIKGFEEKKKKETVDHFDESIPKILEAIDRNLETHLANPNIDRNNPTNPTAQSFILALQAIEDDLNKYNKKDKLDDEIKDIKKIRKKIEEKQQEQIQKQQNITTQKNIFGTHYETKQQVEKEVFEGKKEPFDAMIEVLYNQESGTKEIKPDTPEGNRFIALVKLYLVDDPDNQDIHTIKIGRGRDFGEDKRFSESNERLIQFSYNIKDEKGDIIRTETKHIVRGKNEDLQTIVADKYIPKSGEAYNTQEFATIDRTSKEKGLQQFDDKGNYVAFQRFLETQGENYTHTHFNAIISQICDYTPKTSTEYTPKTSTEQTKVADYDDFVGENFVTLKNGYADIFTQYILTHPGLFGLYCSYLTPSNMNILGADKTTRIKNFNLLTESTTFQEFIKTIPEEQKKAIIDLRTSIAEEKKTTLREGLQTVGNMIVSLMMLFGMGKGALKNRLPESMRKDIDEIYQKQFALEEAEKNAILEITAELKKEKNEKRVETTENNGQKYNIPKATEIQEANKISNIDKKYYHFIDPKIIKKGIELHNKKADIQEVTESDFLIVKNGKQEIHLTGVNNKEEIFKSIIKMVIKDESTRKNIAKANENIRKLGETTKDNKKVEYSEYFSNQDERLGSIITSERDVGRYLVTYLFAGSKDLSYTITENNIIGSDREGGSTNKDDIETQSAKTLNIKSEYLNNGVLKNVSAKRIDEIMENYTEAPDNLLITPKGATTAKKIEKGKANVGGKEIETYVYTDEQTTRVTINDGDKIEEATEIVDTIDTKWEKISTNLNDTKKSTDKTNFEKNDYSLNDNNTYQKDIASLSALFTTENDYANLIGETNKKTLTDMLIKTNMPHIKNMFIYRGLKQNENKDEIFTTKKMDLDANLTSNIDITKQTFSLKEVKDGKITITVEKNPNQVDNATKEGTITIEKNGDGKLTTKRTEKTTT